jgi:hypothetical protein
MPRSQFLTLLSSRSQPDAYVGQNTQLRDTINNLVEKSPQTWHTTVSGQLL